MGVLAALVLQIAAPVESGKWIVPGAAKNARPYWGIKGGIAVGLRAGDGPKGLLRIYAPHLKNDRFHCINFIAIEPVVGEARGFSELEERAMWTADDFEEEPKPRDALEPAAGKVVKIGGAQALTFYLYLESFKNGARPVVQVILREDRPYEVGFRVFAAKGSARMKSCILTATMGNYARLRHVWLRGEVAVSTKVWAEFTPDPGGFAPHQQWPVKRLFASKGEVIVAATPDEADPAKATYKEEVPHWWRFEGKVATQYWRKPDPGEKLVARVNGRKTFYGHPKGDIPGGVSYENFELEEPFSAGQEFWFGVTPEKPEKLGFEAGWLKNLTDGR